MTFVLVVDDLDTPWFRPMFLFELVDTRLPKDWICNLIPHGQVHLILSPAFFAQDSNSYDAMIDLERAQQEQLWHRINLNADDCEFGDSNQ